MIRFQDPLIRFDAREAYDRQVYSIRMQQFLFNTFENSLGIQARCAWLAQFIKCPQVHYHR